LTATAAAFSPRRNLFDPEAVMKLLGALIVSLLFLIGPSPAHDSWISRERFRNPVTLDWCCGREDCGIVMPAPKATAVGWAIHGEEILDLDGRRLRVDEVVSYDETLPSPDGYFYRCHVVARDYEAGGDLRDYFWDGERRCLFAPHQSL
jgi:hypothetical protein